MIAYLKDVIARVTNRLTLTIWVLARSLATLVGPFGTYSAFTIPQRATYWFLVAGVSILVAYGARMAVARLNLKDGSAPFELSSP